MYSTMILALLLSAFTAYLLASWMSTKEYEDGVYHENFNKKKNTQEAIEDYLKKISRRKD